MNKLELLKQKIADVCSNAAYRGNIYKIDDDELEECLFIVENGCIYVLYSDNWDGDYYYSLEYTEEEAKEAQRIIRELDLNDNIYLPIKGSQAYDLKSLIEYYEDGYEDEDEHENDIDEKCEEKIKEIKRLIEVLNQKDCIFYNRNKLFLQLFLHPELKSDVAYVHSDWDHDESYYYGLPFSTGVDDPLYDYIKDGARDDGTILPDSIIDEDECDCWIDILSNIDKQYIFAENQDR